MSGTVRVLCVLGIALSLYALYVEDRIRTLGPTYKALCDVDSWGFSCSKVFNSAHGHIFFGVPNAAFGVLFYIAVFSSTLRLFQCIPFLKYLVLAAVLFAAGFSVMLAYFLYQMRDFCVVCVSTYVLNAGLLYVHTLGSSSLSAKTNKKDR